ncbi:MAG: hypothetical protein WB998_09545 [Solirubrobacteraceae bacterium]
MAVVDCRLQLRSRLRVGQLLYLVSFGLQVLWSASVNRVPRVTRFVFS